MCFLDRELTNEKFFITTYISVIIFAPSFILTFAYLIIIRKLKKINYNFFTSHESSYMKSKTKNDSLNSQEPYAVVTWIRNNSKFESKKFWLRKKEFNRSYSDACSNSISRCESLRLSIKSTKNLDPKKDEYKSCHSYYSNNLLAKRKQTITICLISLAFFFCQLPIKIFQLFNTYYTLNPSSVYHLEILFPFLNSVFMISKFLFFLHSLSNPIIYNLMSSKFSSSFKNVILCKNRKKSEKIFS